MRAMATVTDTNASVLRKSLSQPVGHRVAHDERNNPTFMRNQALWSSLPQKSEFLELLTGERARVPLVTVPRLELHSYQYVQEGRTLYPWRRCLRHFRRPTIRSAPFPSDQRRVVPF